MLCRRGLWLVLVVLLAAYFTIETARIVPGSASVVFAADNYQPMNVKTGLWEVRHTNNLGGSQHTSSYKTCVTAKDLQSNPWGKGPEEKCDWTVIKSTSSDMEVHGTSCEAGKEFGMQTEVSLKIHAVDQSNVKATMQGTSTGNGQTMPFGGTFTGKWVSPSCPAGAN